MSLENIGKYRLDRHLGKGAFGDVFLAHDQALNTTKAIKVLSTPDAREIMSKLEEAQLLHKCKHKNIVRINEANVYEISSLPHIVIDMEYLPLGSFEDAINSGTVFFHDTVRYVIDCLFALEHAHMNGVIHRDIKPANIMLCDYGAKLSDFGLATVIGVNFSASPKGYTTHLAPEFFYTKSTTVLTDIFAVGITLYRACNYIQNWNNSLNMLPNKMQSIQNGSVVSELGYAEFFPLKLKKIINKACHPDPSQRYQSAHEFRRALERLTPKYNWLPQGFTAFTGRCIKTNATLTIETIQTPHSFVVDVKRNNRKVNDSCSQHTNQDDALKQMNKYIASTLY